MEAVGWPGAPHARWPAREGEQQGCGLAAMGAVGMWLGSAVEGSLRWAGSHPSPRALPGAARLLSAEGQAG